MVSYSKVCTIRLSFTRNNQSVGLWIWSTLQTFENNNNFQRQECQLKGFRRSTPTLLAQGIAWYPFGLWAMAVSSKPHIHAHMEEHYLLSKQLSFYFYVYFEGSPPAEEP
jgi:hypothetical protein